MNDIALMKKILLIMSGEDAEMNIVVDSFKKEHYNVFTAPYNDMLYSLNRYYPFDAVVVDVKSHENGIMEKCRQIRLQQRFHDTIIIFITALADDELKAESFDAGVDFFINKPVNLAVLNSKINTVARRLKYNNTVKIQDGICIDKERYLVIWRGNDFYFPKKEFELLSLLMSKMGKVLLRQEILHQVWNLGADADARTVDVHIHRIRQKLGGDLIKTVKGIGYKMSV